MFARFFSTKKYSNKILFYIALILATFFLLSMIPLRSQAIIYEILKYALISLSIMCISSSCYSVKKEKNNLRMEAWKEILQAPQEKSEISLNIDFIDTLIQEHYENTDRHKLSKNALKSPLLESIIISKEALNSPEKLDIIYSNSDFINTLLHQHVREDEISGDALKIYYLEYYCYQLWNGGFSQFVYNSKLQPWIFNYVRDGLKAIGAEKNLELFNKAITIMNTLGQDKMIKFFSSDYYGKNEERDILDLINDEYYFVKKSEDIQTLNSQYLREHPKLLALNASEMETYVKEISQKIPDREARVKKALEEEPRYMKIIRALCKESQQELKEVTIEEPDFDYQGKRFKAWYFITDSGVYYMLDFGKNAAMFKDETNELVTQIKLEVFA